MERPPEVRKAVALILGATLCLAFKGIWARLAYDAGATVGSLLAMRIALSTPLFWLGAWALTRDAGRGPASPLPRRSQVLMAFGCGVLFLLAQVCDFTAIEQIGAGLSRVLMFTFPGFVLLLDSAIERTRPARSAVLGFVVAWLGLLLVGYEPEALALSGVVLALVGAAIYAVYMRLAQRATRRLGGPLFVALVNTSAAVLTVVCAPGLLVKAAAMPWGAVQWVVVMVLVSTVGPFFMLFEGLRRIGATRASLLTLLGPPITLVAAWAILGESISGVQLLGVALVLAGIAGINLRDMRGLATARR